MKPFSIVIALGLCAGIGTVEASVRVVASTSDLAYFAEKVGGDLVTVEAIASPRADAHFVEVRPSYMVKVKRADLALKVGLELDLWMDRIIDGSRNSKLEIVDCSRYIEPVEVPTFKADARYGDLHRFGNPHYWLSPANVRPITQVILDGLVVVDPEHAATYRNRRDAYLAELDDALPRLKEKARALEGREIVFYHNTWPYFNDFVGTIAAGFVEPYPGVPPSPAHVSELTELMRRREIAVIAIEPYFDRRVPQRIAEASGARMITLYPSVGGRDRRESYLEWLEGNMDALIEALE
jgi:ABC-type Zn uptake system ZnuABC Zn-binding protein ZnuA